MSMKSHYFMKKKINKPQTNTSESSCESTTRSLTETAGSSTLTAAASILDSRLSAAVSTTITGIAATSAEAGSTSTASAGSVITRATAGCVAWVEILRGKRLFMVGAFFDFTGRVFEFDIILQVFGVEVLEMCIVLAQNGLESWICVEERILELEAKSRFFLSLEEVPGLQEERCKNKVMVKRTKN